MNDIEKFRAEIDAKLLKFGETVNEIRTKQEIRNSHRPTLNLDATQKKHQLAAEKLKKLNASDASTTESASLKSNLRNLMDDIDNDLRQALAHFS